MWYFVLLNNNTHVYIITSVYVGSNLVKYLIDYGAVKHSPLPRGTLSSPSAAGSSTSSSHTYTQLVVVVGLNFPFPFMILLNDYLKNEKVKYRLAR